MKTILVAGLLALASLGGTATASASALSCIDTGSQWRACVENGCVIVDGPMIHAEECVAIMDLDHCVETGSQWRACVVYPCVIVDGAAFHKEVCLSRVSA